MRILSIETSCDETAISIIEAKGGFRKPQFKIIAETIISQIKLHKEYGGVFPSLAKREHTRNLLPILKTTLRKGKLLNPIKNAKSKLKIINYKLKIDRIMEREPELAEMLIEFVSKNKVPKIDAIAVTQGPGLEPALWTGLNFAKALAILWDKPLVPTNHMEGHVYAFFAKQKKHYFQFPILALLISGGHTQLVLVKDFNKFKIIGQTRDDAVGEAFDKVARTLELSYPGGPEISKLAQEFSKNYKLKTKNCSWDLPRPMINSDDFDFSFSGLKTAVLYKVQKIRKITPKIKQEIAFEFEEAVTEVLFKKTVSALEKYKVKTLILGGGVVANKKIRKRFSDFGKKTKGLKVLIPEIKYTGDNATMIAIAAYFRHLDKKTYQPTKTRRIKANGNMELK